MSGIGSLPIPGLKIAEELLGGGKSEGAGGAGGLTDMIPGLKIAKELLGGGQEGQQPSNNV